MSDIVFDRMMFDHLERDVLPQRTEASQIDHAARKEEGQEASRQLTLQDGRTAPTVSENHRKTCLIRYD
jgi:hypothetical protein